MELFNIDTPIITKPLKPFLKWAGGKTQLLAQIQKLYPKELELGLIDNYYEPFLGGGAVFFNIVNKFNIKNSYLLDNNEDLIRVYKVIQRDVDGLIYQLADFRNKYLSLDTTNKENFYYSIRRVFNDGKFSLNSSRYDYNWISRAAQMIFLNKTCFNGLFRLNRKGDFNVPFGKHKKPKLMDEENLRNASNILQNTEIILGDFSVVRKIIKKNSFVYFDPPYRPISRTANFTNYSKEAFDDRKQAELAVLFIELNKPSVKLMLSNSNPQNNNVNDNFFHELYKDFVINTIEAKRIINCNGQKRGKIQFLIECLLQDKVHFLSLY